MHGDTIRSADARAHTTRANSTPQRSGARAVQQLQRDGMADSKFEVHAIVGERFYRFRHELRVEWAEAEEGDSEEEKGKSDETAAEATNIQPPRQKINYATSFVAPVSSVV